MSHKKLLILLCILLFALQDGLLIYNFFNSKQSIVGLKLQGQTISRMTGPQLSSVLYAKYPLDQTLRLRYGLQRFAVKKSDIGAAVDYQGTVAALLTEGRSRSLLENLLTQDSALLGFDDKSALSSISAPLLLVKVLSIADDINRQPQPAAPNFTGDMKVTIPAKDGVKVDTNRLSSLIVHNIFSPPREDLAISVGVVKRQFTTAGLDDLRTKALQLTSTPISLVASGFVFTLTPADLRSLLEVVEKPDPANPQKSILALALDDRLLSKKLLAFSTKVEAATQAEFNEYAARGTIYAQFYSNTRRFAQIPMGGRISERILGAQTTNGPKSVYLTFDDGPNVTYQPLLLDILKAKGVKVTFYFVGSSSNLYKSVTQRTISEGHVIGDHTLTHPFLPQLSQAKIFDEMRSTKTILEGFTSAPVTLFRPPFGGTSSYVGQVAKNLGFKTEFWDCDPKDWTDPSTDDLVNRVISCVKDGSVVLMHSNHFATVKALPIIIDKLKEKGYTFKTQS